MLDQASESTYHAGWTRLAEPYNYSANVDRFAPNSGTDPSQGKSETLCTKCLSISSAFLPPHPSFLTVSPCYFPPLKKLCLQFKS